MILAACTLDMIEYRYHQCAFLRRRLPHLSSLTTSHNLRGLAAQRERHGHVHSPHQTHRAV